MTIVTNDVDLRTLVINQLTARQYNAITPDENQIYFVEETKTVDEKIADALNGYTPSSNLANVALTGNYDDLINKPTLSDVAYTGDYNDLLNTPSLSDVAYTGDYNDLTNTPSIPDDYVVSVSTPSIVYGTDINGDQTEYNLNSFGAIDDVTLNGNSVVVNKVASLNVANVALTGNYDDLINKPTIPEGVVVDQVYNGLSTNAQSGVALESVFTNKQDLLVAGTNVNITNNTISTTSAKVTFRTWSNS